MEPMVSPERVAWQHGTRHLGPASCNNEDLRVHNADHQSCTRLTSESSVFYERPGGSFVYQLVDQLRQDF